MRRTERLQEVRKMRFEEACGGWQERRLTQEEEARLLGVCERTACPLLLTDGTPPRHPPLGSITTGSASRRRASRQ